MTAQFLGCGQLQEPQLMAAALILIAFFAALLLSQPATVVYAEFPRSFVISRPMLTNVGAVPGSAAKLKLGCRIHAVVVDVQRLTSVLEFGQ